MILCGFLVRSVDSSRIFAHTESMAVEPRQCLSSGAITRETAGQNGPLKVSAPLRTNAFRRPLAVSTRESTTISQSAFEVVYGRLLTFLAWIFCEPWSVKARRVQKHDCKSAKGKEQKDKRVFQRGMTFFVFERLFHWGKFHEDYDSKLQLLGTARPLSATETNRLSWSPPSTNKRSEFGCQTFEQNSTLHEEMGTCRRFAQDGGYWVGSRVDVCLEGSFPSCSHRVGVLPGVFCPHGPLLVRRITRPFRHAPGL